MNATPQYRLVYESLRKHIEQGVYSEGDILPSENELCIVHNVTRPTVRKALDMLTNEGFIKRRQGLGSLVQSKPRGIGILSIAGTTSVIGRENLVTRVVVKPVVKRWPADFPFGLTKPERESGCIYFERVRLVNGQPIFYDISYLPNMNLPRFTRRKLDNHSLFNLLREVYHIKITGGEQNIKAIHASTTVQNHLDVDPSTPILHLERKLETSRIYFNVFSFLYCDTREHALFGSF
ncbi:MAG: GntR family transcriptional regulator [Bacteroidales bacterium]|nr:GntR family transcriptional regulator [Bacteroidales bacterium]